MHAWTLQSENGISQGCEIYKDEMVLHAIASRDGVRLQETFAAP